MLLINYHKIGKDKSDKTNAKSKFLTIPKAMAEEDKMFYTIYEHSPEYSRDFKMWFKTDFYNIL